MIRRAAFACFALVVSPLQFGETSTPAAIGSAPIEIDDHAEIEEHRRGPRPVVVTPWRDATTDPRFGGWVFDLTIDERGVVVWATPKYGPKNLREEATRAARTTRFKPFVRDGRPVAARVRWKPPPDS